jgi:hypothetical protein
MTVIVPPSGRPGQGGQHDHLREGSYTLAVAGASWRRSGCRPHLIDSCFVATGPAIAPR